MTLMTPSSSSSSSRVKTGTRGAHEEFTRYRKLWSQVTGGVIPRIVLRKSHSGVNIRIMQALYDISIGFLEIGLIWLAWYAIARVAGRS